MHAEHMVLTRSHIYGRIQCLRAIISPAPEGEKSLSHRCGACTATLPMWIRKLAKQRSIHKTPSELAVVYACHILQKHGPHAGKEARAHKLQQHAHPVTNDPCMGMPILIAGEFIRTLRSILQKTTDPTSIVSNKGILHPLEQSVQLEKAVLVPPAPAPSNNATSTYRRVTGSHAVAQRRNNGPTNVKAAWPAVGMLGLARKEALPATGLDWFP